VDWARKFLWKVNKEGAIGVDLLALSDFSCLWQSLSFACESEHTSVPFAGYDLDSMNVNCQNWAL